MAHLPPYGGIPPARYVGGAPKGGVAKLKAYVELSSGRALEKRMESGRSIEAPHGLRRLDRVA